jgi:hypothetical protein
MKLSSAKRISFRTKPQPENGAFIRTILLVLVSFVLGVAGTAFWFHLAGKRNVENSNLQTAGQPAASAANAQSPAQPVAANQPPISPAAIEEVKQAVPNFASVSVEDGEKILRMAALKEFSAAAKEMNGQVKKAQEQLLQAESGLSDAEQQAAMKQVQQTQTAAAENLQQVAARLDAQIAALKSLKNQQ